MPFSLKPKAGFPTLTLPEKLGLFMLVWLMFISLLHYQLNHQSRGRKIVRMGYMPVVTNLAAPLLD